MKYQRGKTRGWKIAIVLLAMMLACGLLIALDVRKVAAEKKFEPKPSTTKSASSLPLPSPDSN